MNPGYLGTLQSQLFQSTSFSCPQTLLRLGTSLQLATINLALGQRLRVRLAQIAVPRTVARYAGFYTGLSGNPVYLEEGSVRQRQGFVWGRPYRANDVVQATNTDFPGVVKTFICLQSNVLVDPWASSAVLRPPLPFTPAEQATIQAGRDRAAAFYGNTAQNRIDVTPPDYAGVPSSGPARCVPPYAVRPAPPQTSLTYWTEFTGATARVNSSLGPVFVGLYAQSTVTRTPGGRPLFSLSSGLEGAVTTEPRKFRDFTAPGLYTFYAVNNTLYADCEIVVTGVARVLE